MQRKQTHNHRMTIAYDGTQYAGWQRQPNGVTIQSTIEDVLKTILRCDLAIIGSGRTDAGVHANGQIAHLRIEEETDLRRLHYSMNMLLPKDIRILEIAPASEEFHAQQSAKQKSYRYYFCFETVVPPFLERYRWHLRRQLSIELLAASIEELVGTHDFSAFANENQKGAAAVNPVRTIFSAGLFPAESSAYLEITADGFLYKMVRNLVGTLLEIATGQETRSMSELLKTKDRRATGATAPPQGLFLHKVIY